MLLKIKKLHPDAIIPRYATPGSACFDLHAMLDLLDFPVVIQPGYSAVFKTGLAFEIDPEWRLDIYSRSGHGFNSGVRLVNCVGKIDSDYRNEVMVKLHNDGAMPFVVRDGDRIAQAELNPVHRAESVEVDELSETQRAGGFGSTGK